MMRARVKQQSQRCETTKVLFSNDRRINNKVATMKRKVIVVEKKVGIEQQLKERQQ